MTTSSRHPLSIPAAPARCLKRLALVTAALAALASLQPPDRAAAQPAPERLTSRPRPPAPKATTAAVGDEIVTRAGERRRLALADGSTLYVNADTRAKLDGRRRLILTSGEVYVEAAPATAEEDPFSVRARSREASGRGAHFNVRAAPAGAAVVVARGKVEVSGLPNGLTAGQQVAADGDRAAPAPRASHALGWTRELMAAAESPLVPASKHAGGALIAKDPNGQEASLSLRKYHIDVHIEDGFARTTIDQTYFNDSPAQLEGTFYFPLPPDASLSRLAMYVSTDGDLCQLMEGGMAERDHARQVYETIRYARRDPALLEWVDGSTFKMRVFPLEGRQEKRIVLSYSQRLPVLYDETTYRFPAGHNLQTVRDWSFHARVKGGNGSAWASPSHTLKAAAQGKDLLLTASAKDARIDRDVVLSLHDATPAAAGKGVARFSMAEHEKARYLMLRYRPTVSGEAKPQRRDWVFLFESSGDRDPLLGRVQIEVIRHLLAKAEAKDTFNVLTAGTRVRAFARAGQAVTPQNVAAAIAFLERAHLVGALDLGRALSEAAAVLKGAANPCLVHVGSGVPAMGERRHDELVKRLPEKTEYVGVGVGRRWNRSLMKLAAERTGGLFTQINPDEPVAWRTFELSARLNTPRLQRVTVTDADTGKALLCYGTEVAQGEELCALTRIGPGGELPSAVKVRGEVAGKAFEHVVPVRDVSGRADYLPRTWAKLEIDRLLAEDPIKHKKEIVELSKAMYVMTPFTSLLVLENEDLYTQYKVDRGRKDHWALYPCPAKIPLVYEPDPSQPDPKLLKSGAKLPAKQVLQTVVVRQAPELLTAASPFTSGGQESRGGEWRLNSAPRFVPPSLGTDLWGKLPALRAPVAVPAAPPGEPERKELFSFYVGLFRDNISSQRPQIIAGGGVLPVADLTVPATHGFIDPVNISSALPGMDGLAPALLALDPVAGAKVGEVVIAGREIASDRVLRRARLFAAGEVLADPGAPRGEPPARLSLQSLHLPAAVDPFVEQMRGGSVQTPSLLYERPSFKDDARHFADLLAYAPGMNTSLADMEAVLEAEAIPDPADRPGTIDEAARDLIAKARARGWTAWKIEDGKTTFTILFDGEGRFAYQRAPALGLRERVACDGTTLLHLYPQLGLAARRAVSRFHRADLAAAVPWFVPPAADLARGADLKLVAERTVAIVPRGAESAKGKDGKPRPYARVHLLFDADGGLAERQVVRMPKAEILYREVCTADGTLKILDGKDKELLTRKGTLTPAEAPDLTPDTKNLVVLPLPYRTRDHVRRTLKIEKKANNELRFADAIQLLAADVAQGNANAALAVFQQALHAREQRQLGLYVLLAAAGVNLDAQNADVLAEHLDDPVAQYLALHSSPVLRKHASQWAVASAQWGDGLLRHLAVSHALLQRWQSDKVLKRDPGRPGVEARRALDYVRQHRGTAWGWALLGLMQDRAGKDKQLHAALAECWPLFEDVPGLRYAARYERGRSLWRAGQQDEARRAFEKLYADTVKDGVLPAVDADCRAALLAQADRWGELLRDTAARLVADKKRPAVLALAWQCWQLEDAPLANHLLGVALDGIKDKKERLPMKLAGLGFLWRTGQLPQADKLLQEVLSDAEAAKHASLWRLAADLAGKRDMTARGLECLEKALDVEYAKLPEVIDLSAVRRDYGQLLTHYQSLTDAMVTLKVRPPDGFLAKAVRAADRWRALDREATDACRAVARILQRLGDRELGWDYLTTPVGLKPNEAAPWVELAEALRQKGDVKLADRAYTAAFEAEPTNAQLLWDRAQNLRQAGQTVEARRLLRQLADGTWQPRFQAVQTQARRELEEGG